MDGGLKLVRFERNDTVRQKFSQGVVYFRWRFEMRGTEGYVCLMCGAMVDNSLRKQSVTTSHLSQQRLNLTSLHG